MKAIVKNTSVPRATLERRNAWNSFVNFDDQLSRLIGDIYDAAIDPLVWPRALENCCRFIGAHSAVLFWHDSTTGLSNAVHIYNEDPAYTKLYFEKYAPLNPVFPAAFFLAPGDVHLASDLVPDHELVETRFYKEWLAPQGITEALAVVLERTKSSSAFFNVRMIADNGLIDDSTRKKARLIVPHLQRAMHIGRLFDQTATHSRNLIATLQHVDAAVFLVASDASLVFSNNAGDRLLDDARVVCRIGRRLGATSPLPDEQLRTIIETCGTGDRTVGTRGVSIPLSVRDDNRWFAHVLPMTSGSRSQSGSLEETAAAVYVRRTTPDTVSSLEMLAAKYRLTASEVRVYGALLKESGVRSIARGLGISEATVKTHLHNLFQKCGVKRQSDLIKLIAAADQTYRD